MNPPRSRLLRDALIISASGVGLGLIANAISPRGLSLTRDYFGTPGLVSDAQHTPAPQGRTPAPVREQTTTTEAGGRTARGLPLISHEDAAVLFRDPARAGQRIVFIDARNEKEYATGHIPGALRFDHYRPEGTLQQVLAATLVAERVVVYCTGGECEDSDLAAADLISLGIPQSRIVIYSGGINEWRRRGMPLEPDTQPGSAQP